MRDEDDRRLPAGNRRRELIEILLAAKRAVSMRFVPGAFAMIGSAQQTSGDLRRAHLGANRLGQRCNCGKQQRQGEQAPQTDLSAV
jgi:hypothetical protein